MNDRQGQKIYFHATNVAFTVKTELNQIKEGKMRITDEEEHEKLHLPDRLDERDHNRTRGVLCRQGWAGRVMRAEERLLQG